MPQNSLRGWSDFPGASQRKLKLFDRGVRKYRLTRHLEVGMVCWEPTAAEQPTRMTDDDDLVVLAAIDGHKRAE